MRSLRGLALPVAIGLAALALPLIASPYHLRILNLAAVAAISVLGLNFAFGYAGLITLAQAGFAGIGAYATALLSTRLGWSFWLTLPLAVAAASLAALLIAVPVLRLRGHYLALATLGFNVSLEIVASNWKSLLGGNDGITGIGSPALGGVALDSDARYFYLLWVALAGAALLAWRIRGSALGAAMIAVRDDEIAASTSSVNVVRVKIQAFVLSAAYAGLSGALFAHLAGYISPGDFNLAQSITTLAMLIVGGEGTIAGAIAGAIIVTFMPEWLRFLGQAYLVFFGLFLLAVLVFLPKGLLSLLRLGRSPA